MQRFSLGLILLVVVMLPAGARPPVKRPASAPRAHAPSAANNAAINAYLGRLRAKLIGGWLIPDGKNNVTINAVVNGDGTIESSTTVSTPSNASAEQSGNESWAKVQPLEGLPTGVSKAKLTVSFISTADPHGDSSSNITTQMTPVAAPKPAAETPAAAPAAAQ